MEEKKGSNCGGCSGWCGRWYGSHHSGFHVIQWLLGLIIIMIVFWVGLNVGEFKSSDYSQRGGTGYHQTMMGGHGVMNHYASTTAR